MVGVTGVEEIAGFEIFVSEKIVVKILFATSSLPRNFQPAFLSATRCIFDQLESKPYVVAHFPEVGASDRCMR